MTSESPHSNGSILVVDDTPQNLKLLSSVLVKAGYDVRCVISGSAALMGIRAERPDLILLDINMPQMNGYDVCRQLKQDPQTQDIPIIFLSALYEVMDKVQAFKVGGVDYITKPFQLEEVLARIQTHLTILRLQQQLREKNQLLELELARAGQIQADLLPAALPQLKAFDLAALCVPAHDVGGDFYDWIQMSPDSISFVLGDVMGKGMPAALLMATARATLRATAHLGSPLEVIQQVVKALEPDLIRSQSFVTLFYAQLQIQQRLLTYVDAGHSHRVMLRDGSKIESLITTGAPIGGIRLAPYFQKQVQLKPGDTLLIYSDGLWDARPDLNLDLETLIKTIATCQQAQDVVRQITSVLEIETARDRLTDDVTLLVLKCLE